jgi:hypothetical protein
MVILWRTESLVLCAFKIGLVRCLYDVGWSVNDVEDREGSGCGLIEVLSRDFLGGTEERH